MPGPFKNRQYRIGDFAKYLGVTPDFLKHYEDNGLVHASRQNGGYRFFVFQQSARILEFMRLRNCGVHIKDIRSMLSAANEEESIAMLDQRFEEVRKNIEFETAILTEHEQFKKWHAKRLEKPVDWEIGEVEPHYFLPHTNHQDFIDDERIYELLKAWSAWMPIVKSGMLLEPSADSGAPVYRLGLIVRASDAERHQLSLNSIVRRLPARKAFIYHFVEERRHERPGALVDRTHPLYALMNKLGLEPADTLYSVIEMKSFGDESRDGRIFGRFIVPIE